MNISTHLWAPLKEALHLIMTGSWSGSVALTQTQRKILQHITTLASNPTPTFAEIRNRPSHLSASSSKSNLEWYIPDIVRYLVTQCIEFEYIESHLDLDFLNTLADDDGRFLFAFSVSTRNKDWELSAAGIEHWGLMSKQDALLKNLKDQASKDFSNDPVQLEASIRLRKAFEGELAEVRGRIATIDADLSGPPVNVEPEPLPWIAIARAKAQTLAEEHPRLSIMQIAERVHQHLKDIRITGRGGRFPSAETICRHALSGIKRS